MYGGSFHMPVKAPGLFILCHESNQDDCSLRSAFLSDSLPGLKIVFKCTE
jgi:hypothetical protein